MRATSGHRPCTNRNGEQIEGWYVRIKDGVVRQSIYRMPGKHEAMKLSPQVIEDVRRKHVAAVQGPRVRHFAKSLGVTEASLAALGIGWDIDKQAWTFPMFDAQGRVVGLRYRRDNGAKWSLAGGSEGIFKITIERAGPVVICEGPTSAAAWITLGCNVIGRPSCTGGVKTLRAVASMLARPVLIVADRDSRKARPDGSFFYPGQDGAAALYERLKIFCNCAWAICPVSNDARDWIKRGATPAMVKDWIDEQIHASVAETHH